MEEEKRLLASSSSESSSSRLIFFLFHLVFFFLSKLCARLSPLSLSFLLFYSLSSDTIEKKKKTKKKKASLSFSLFSSFECLVDERRRINTSREQKREKVPLLTKSFLG